ncbi:unnamed protein product, partial [Iphiclides podalirius]
MSATTESPQSAEVIALITNLTQQRRTRLGGIHSDWGLGFELALLCTAWPRLRRLSQRLPLSHPADVSADRTATRERHFSKLPRHRRYCV